MTSEKQKKNKKEKAFEKFKLKFVKFCKAQRNSSSRSSSAEDWLTPRAYPFSSSSWTEAQAGRDRQWQCQRGASISRVTLLSPQLVRPLFLHHLQLHLLLPVDPNDHSPGIGSLSLPPVITIPPLQWMRLHFCELWKFTPRFDYRFYLIYFWQLPGSSFGIIFSLVVKLGSWPESVLISDLKRIWLKY